MIGKKRKSEGYKNESEILKRQKTRNQKSVRRGKRDVDYESYKKMVEFQPNTKTGGVYIPPFKLKHQDGIVTDKKSVEYQRIHWNSLKKSIKGLINKINISNIREIIRELFQENIVRGRGILSRSIMKSQLASPMFTNVYSCLVSVVNTRMPEIGELILKRLIYYFRKSYERNDKQKCVSLLKFLAHLINQRVVNEILGGQILALLLENPTSDSVELSVNFTKECGKVLTEVSPKIIFAVFERLRSILSEGVISKRVQYKIEGLFVIRKNNFKDYPSIVSELELVEVEQQYIHDIELDEEINIEDHLDYFVEDKEFEKHENEYTQIKAELLGDDDDDDDDEEEEEELCEKMEENKFQKTQDDYASDIIKLKKQVYLIIMSCVDFQECVHKLIKEGLTENHEMEVCSMIIECCSQEKTYLRYYGLLAQRFCDLDRVYQVKFEECFRIRYSMIHRLETNKLRNLAKIFSHLLSTDSISWCVFENIRITEDETTSSCRIFIKILFQDLVELLGLKKLKEKLNDEYLKEHFEGLFPCDDINNSRYSINFFTSIGLGQLTLELRQQLKSYDSVKKKSCRNESSSSSECDSDGK